MSNDPQKDPIEEIADAVKKHPVESFIAYDVLVSKEKKKEVNEALAGWGVAGLMLLLLCLLVAPLFEFFFLKDLRAEAAGKTNPDPDAIWAAKACLWVVRIIAWFVAAIAWAFVIKTEIDYYCS